MLVSIKDGKLIPIAGPTGFHCDFEDDAGEVFDAATDGNVEEQMGEILEEQEVKQTADEDEEEEDEDEKIGGGTCRKESAAEMAAESKDNGSC